MNDKQLRFCEEYLIDLNATQAAIRAGYSPKTAKEQGSRLLSNANVRARIDKDIAERSKRVGVNQQRVIRELARIAFVKITDVVDIEEAIINPEADPGDLAAIASVKVKTIPNEAGMGIEREVKLADKIKALDLLGRHLGMYTTKVNVNADIITKGVENLESLAKQMRPVNDDEVAENG